MIVEEFHPCHYCGEYVREGYDPQGNRHWLSDCRPDLVKHEIGETCTWQYKSTGVAEIFGVESVPVEETCYAFRDHEQSTAQKAVWTTEHSHFYEDGPM